jgi:metallo-beta-lactamase family protein
VTKPRARATPYDIQLRKLVDEWRANGQVEPFSAKTLHEQLEHGSGRGRFASEIGNINKALRRLWADGDVISFRDEAGELVCEREFVAPGSKAVSHPQLFGLPGTTPPDGTAACTYEEFVGIGAAAHDNGHSDDADTDRTEVAEAEEFGDEDEGGDDHRSERELALDAANVNPEEFAKRLEAGISEPAPDWLDDELLRFWVTLPTPLRRFRQGLDQAHDRLKKRFVMTGIGRKGSPTPDSAAAEQLVRVCREDRMAWKQCVNGVLDDEEAAGRVLDHEDIPAFIADPVGLFLEREGTYSATLLLAHGIHLGLGESQLDDLAEEALSAYREQLESAGRRSVEERVERLEQRLQKTIEERDLAKAAERDAREQVRLLELRVGNLSEDVERANNEQLEKAGALKDELARLQQSQHALREKNEAFRAEVESLRAEGTRLEAELAERPASDEIERESLLELMKERELRERSEVDLQGALRRIDELSRELEATQEDGVLTRSPTSASELATLLDRAVGAVTVLAAQRLQEGQADAVDELTLRFAGQVGQFRRELSTIAPKPAEVEPTPQASDVEAEEPVTDQAEAAPAEGAEAPSRLSGRRRTRVGWTIRPLGGAGEIGASALLATSPSGESVLLDCGQRVKGTYGAPSPNNYHFDVPGGSHISATLISHAHIDHIGSLPVLHRNRFREQGKRPLPVYMSEPTRDLGEIMLRDSAKLQSPRVRDDRVQLGLGEFDAGMMGEHAYTEDDVKRVLDEHVETRDPYTLFPVGDSSIVGQFIPVAHVLGSCAIRLKDQQTGRTLLYTGDLGPLAEPQLSLSSYGGLDLIETADLVVMESTYAAPPETDLGEPPKGRRLSDGPGVRERRIAQLSRICKATIQNGGCVLLPAFSLGRVQELARILNDGWNDAFPPAPVYIGGMGETITNIYDDYQRRRGPQNEPWVSPGTFVRTTSLHKRLEGSTFEEVVEEVLESGPAYVLATPAMLGGGWSQQFVERMASDPRHAIVFTGFLPQDRRSSQNLGELKKGDSFRCKSGQRISIRAEWTQIGLSAHASRDDLLTFARAMATRGDGCAIAAMHGEPRSQLALVEEVRDFTGVNDAQSLENGVPWTTQGP